MRDTARVPHAFDAQSRRTGPAPAAGPDRLPHRMLALQRQAGNAAVGALLQVQRQPQSPASATGTSVLFDRNSATVELPLRDQIGHFLNLRDVAHKKYPRADKRIIVDGYQSSAESRGLARRRADAVRQIMETSGVPPEKIIITGQIGSSHRERQSQLTAVQDRRVVISPWDPAGFRGHEPPDPRQRPQASSYPGLGRRKGQVLGAHADLLDLAIAMLETDYMDASTYPFGDGKTDPDSMCYGIFKQNWHHIRTSGAMPQGRPWLPQDSGTGGALLNNNLELDIQVLHASQAQLGMDSWFAAHREGGSGYTALLAAARECATPAQLALLSSVTDYRSAVMWIHDELVRNPDLRTDDKKFWVQVRPV